MELIGEVQKHLQDSRKNIGLALDSLRRMPDHADPNNTVNWAHREIIYAILNRIDYELHAAQNTVPRRHGTYPHEDYTGVYGAPDQSHLWEGDEE